MKKILLVTPEYPPITGGIAAFSYMLMQLLQSRGYTTQVFISGDQSSNKDFISFKKAFKATYYPFKAIARFKKLSNLIRTYEPDVIITTGTFPLMVGWLLTFIFNSTIFINVLHGNELRKPIRKIVSIMLNRYTHLIAVSEFTKSLISYEKIKARCKVIPNGILSNWLKMEGAKTYSDAISFLTVGTIRKRKGHIYIINAMPALVKIYPNLTYVICGNPDYPDYLLELKNRSEQLNVERRVFFEAIAYGEMERLKKMYDKTTIYMLLSQTQPNGDTEGFGITILEANARGVPVIGARGTGVESAIKDGYNGILVTAGVNDELIAAIREILNNYENYSSQSLQWAYKHRWDKLVGQYERLFD